VVFVLACLWWPSWFVFAQSHDRAYLPYADAAPVFDTLRSDLIPSEFRGKTTAQREALWPGWVERRDAEIRARVAAGDEDSVVNFLLYGTTFTKRPRPTERQIGDLVSNPREALTWLRPRIADLVAALATAGNNERLQFSREVLRRRAIDPVIQSGAEAAARYLEERALAMSASGALRTQALLDGSATELSKRLTLFHGRGLSSDTSLFIDYGIDATLQGLAEQKLLPRGSVRRVAVIGPGLDFSDKLDGYDFYPPQTIQPFAILDSLKRIGLAAANLQVLAFDLSPRVLEHLEAARTRARAGRPYPIALPRNLDQPWSAPLLAYWRRMGGTIGNAGPPVMPPPNAGRAEVRSLAVSPSVVLSVSGRDLNVVLQRPDPIPDAERFDLVIATNILIYYDVFEQSLAGINIAKILRPRGFLLTNDRIFELPTTPLSGVGFTDVTYFALPGVGNTGARVIWYRKQ
jgi:hypothetical protein